MEWKIIVALCLIFCCSTLVFGASIHSSESENGLQKRDEGSTPMKTGEAAQQNKPHVTKAGMGDDGQPLFMLNLGPKNNNKESLKRVKRGRRRGRGRNRRRKGRKGGRKGKKSKKKSKKKSGGKKDSNHKKVEWGIKGKKVGVGVKIY